jgi:hypothetical protein
MEMLYQFEYDYRFDSSKLSGRWDSRPPDIAKALPQR